MSLEQSHFQIQEVLFDSERHTQPFDIAPSIIELNIFEDIEKPYLTGTMLQVDNVAFKSSVGITGSERVAISLKSATGEIITKKFIITAIQKEVSTNERTDVRLLTLLEEHAYLSNILKISKAYTGSPARIIQNILSSYLDKGVNINGSASGTDPNIKLIVPNLNPLVAVEWIRDKMATSVGAPYFAYASLRSNNITLTSLDKMMVTESWNKDRPYTYSQSAHNTQAPESQSEHFRKLFHIEKFTTSKIESTLMLAQAGAITANFNTVDITSGEMYRSTQYSDINVRRLLDHTGQGLGKQEENGLNFNSEMVIGTPNRGYEAIKRIPTKNFTQVTADTYKDANSYSYEKDDQYRLGLKMKAAQLRSVLLNNVYSMSVPGVPYLIDPDAGVGSNIQIQFPKNTTDPSNVGEIDAERSGKFLAYRTRHQFVKPSRYAVHMNIVKLTRTIN